MSPRGAPRTTGATGALAAGLAVALAGLAPARADSMHCGQSVVQTGDRAAEVVQKCGPPDAREELRETLCDDHGCCHTLVVGERWTYDQGETRLVRTLILRDGRLAEVKTGGYGGRR